MSDELTICNIDNRIFYNNLHDILFTRYIIYTIYYLQILPMKKDGLWNGLIMPETHCKVIWGLPQTLGFMFSAIRCICYITELLEVSNFVLET